MARIRKKTLCSTISLRRTLRSPKSRVTRLGDRMGAGTLRDCVRVTGGTCSIRFYAGPLGIRDWGLVGLGGKVGGIVAGAPDSIRVGPVYFRRGRAHRAFRFL